MKRLVSIGLILFVLISGGLIFDSGAPETASASIIDKIELTDQRTRTSKTYWLGETPEGNQRYVFDDSIGSVHYREGSQWLEIDSSIQQSNKANWDWEVVKGHWQLLVKDDTSVAIGKDGHWIGFRYEGFAYLDKSTGEYVILDNRRQVTPTIEGNKIRWEGIFYGVNLEYVYDNDRFKENLEITQAARDWLSANPPISYGLNNQTTYLVGYIQCDWRYSYQAKDADGNSINWTNINEFQETPINFWHPVQNRIVSALPVDYAYHLTDLEFEPLKLRKRFIRAPNGDNYLLFGASVLDLNRFPAGTIVFDPTVDERVGASLDDTQRNLGNNIYDRTGLHNFTGSSSEPNYQMGSGMRFQSVNVPNGATINAASVNFTCSFSRDGADCYAYISAEDVDDAAEWPAASGDFDTRYANRTTANTTWDNIPAWTVNSVYQSPDIASSIQEVVDRGGWAANQDMAIFFEDYADRSTHSSANRRLAYSYDNDSAKAPLLHIDYTVGGGPSAPTVATYNATSVEETTATLVGNITATGGENATDRGFYWDIDSGNPYANNWFEQGNFGVGQYTHGITSLTEGELYYAIASANNSGGTGNGTEVTFLTKPDEPTAFTATSQNSTRISFSWTNGDGRDTTLVRYNSTGYPPDKTSGNLSYNGTATSHNITSLSPGQIYYVHIYSWAAEGGLEQNSDLTDNVTDYTLPGDPSGMVSENVTATSIDVRWTKGTAGDYSMVRRKADSYPTGVSDGNQAYYNTGSDFSDSGLSKGTSYYYRAWARDTDSNYYSASYTSATATTNVTAPTVVNVAASNIASTTATINGNLTDDGGESCNVTMFWGTANASDNASAWEHEVDKGSLATGAFFENLTSLNVTTQYFFISRAINTEGTDWADTTANFTTLAVGVLAAPTDFTATYINENEVDLVWTPGIQAEFTMVRASYERAPANIEEGYCVWYGTGSNVTDFMVELNLRDTTIHYSAFSENTSQSWAEGYATASVVNMGMSDFIDAFVPLILVLGLAVLAYWRRNGIVDALAGFGFILYGFDFWSSSTYISILLVLAGGSFFIKAKWGNKKA